MTNPLPQFKRPVFRDLQRHLRERRFLQVLIGPRQAGKTTLAWQAVAEWEGEHHYASADGVAPPGQAWIEQQWGAARLVARDAPTLLVLDEVQKIPGWSDVVKALWDADTAAGRDVRVLLLGSSALLLRHGLGESLAGRFEVLPITHWSYPEMREAFGWDVDRFIYFGGYPGAAPLIDDRDRWARYVVDSLVETTLSRDVLLMARVTKPALLRQLFLIGCRQPAEIVSFQKMLGQLQDAGNTTTLANYLDLLEAAGLIAGVRKFTAKAVRQRGSSPKLVPLNTALVSSQGALTFDAARRDSSAWGRLVETAVGAHLLNATVWHPTEVRYWRHRSHEVDWVLRLGDSVVAIEVKSGRARGALSGITAFDREFRPTRKLLVGGSGIDLDRFLSLPVARLVEP